MNQYEDHPIAGIFPMLPQDKLNDLAEDIHAHGLKQDITLYEDKILDGRNRYRACLQAGVNPTFVVYAGDDPVGHVLSLNQHRRHLTPSQLAGIAAAAMPHFQAEAKKRQVRKPRSVPAIVPEQKFDARAAAAAAVGVSPRYVSDACRLKEQDPELAEKVKSGDLSLPAAMRQMREERGETPATPAPEFQDSAGEAGAQPEQDGEKLCALKAAWKRCSKKDRQELLAWAYPPPTPPVSGKRDEGERIVVVIDVGRNIWDLAKARLDTMGQNDASRVPVLIDVANYAQRRLKEGK